MATHRLDRKRGALAARRRRVRRRVAGTPARPRLSVGRSARHVHAQLIDDEAGRTLAFASSLEEACPAGTKTERARWTGARLAERAKAAGIARAVFDRGGRMYHGRIRALAEAAREGGLSF
jgi:large subunit ribosomal protein L18